MSEEKDIKGKGESTKKKSPAPEAQEANPTEEAKATEDTGNKPGKSNKKKGRKRKLLEAHIHINATYNNTIITVSEVNGESVCWASAGACGFKGTRKATPYAASITAETAMNKAKAMGVERVHITIKGIGAGRDQALRSINATGVQIESLTDKTAVPHNGCRARKRRRV